MLAAAASLLALALLGEPGERFSGVARLADGRVAYVEEHEVRWEGGRPVEAATRYLDAEGRPIARLDSDYRAAPFAPDYLFVDWRHGWRHWVRRAGSEVELGDGGERRLLRPGPERPLVAGQGVDRFIRAHLAELGRGQELAVLLALPGRLAAYEFRVRGEPLPGGLTRAHLEPRSPFLRLLAPAVAADYDASGRLVRYRGVSNLPDAEGATQQVEIAYAYADAPAP